MIMEKGSRLKPEKKISRNSDVTEEKTMRLVEELEVIYREGDDAPNNHLSFTSVTPHGSPPAIADASDTASLASPVRETTSRNVMGHQADISMGQAEMAAVPEPARLKDEGFASSAHSYFLRSTESTGRKRIGEDSLGRNVNGLDIKAVKYESQRDIIEEGQSDILIEDNQSDMIEECTPVKTLMQHLKKNCSVDFLGIQTIREELQDILNIFCSELTESHPFFNRCRPVLRGSMSENTKVGVPDEIDFMIVIPDVEEYLSLDVKAVPGIVTIKPALEDLSPDRITSIMSDALERSIPQGWSLPAVNTIYHRVHVSLSRSFILRRPNSHPVQDISLDLTLATQIGEREETEEMEEEGSEEREEVEMKVEMEEEEREETEEKKDTKERTKKREKTTGRQRYVVLARDWSYCLLTFPQEEADCIEKLVATMDAQPDFMSSFLMAKYIAKHFFGHYEMCVGGYTISKSYLPSYFIKTILFEMMDDDEHPDETVAKISGDPLLNNDKTKTMQPLQIIFRLFKKLSVSVSDRKLPNYVYPPYDLIQMATSFKLVELEVRNKCNDLLNVLEQVLENADMSTVDRLIARLSSYTYQHFSRRGKNGVVGPM